MVNFSAFLLYTIPAGSLTYFPLGEFIFMAMYTLLLLTASREALYAVGRHSNRGLDYTWYTSYTFLLF